MTMPAFEHRHSAVGLQRSADAGLISLLKGDTDVALAFIGRYRSPGGTVCLIATASDGLATGTFVGRDLGRLRDWIDERQGRSNIYLVLDEAVAAVCISSAEGAERERQLDQLATSLFFAESPNLVIDGGGEYQCFWVLDAVPFGGEGADIEGFVARLQARFGADSVADADRLVRLPGTIYLSERPPALVRVSYESGERYSLRSLQLDDH